MRTPCPRGVTLIEVMIALAILMFASVGMLGLQSTGFSILDDARRSSRATAIASDLVEQIASWDYLDPRLNAGANTDVGDSGFLAQGPAYAGQYGEANLGAAWTGIPTAELQGDYQRFWNVFEDDLDGDGQPDVKRIGVVVRWTRSREASAMTYRRLVLVTVKTNPVAVSR